MIISIVTPTYNSGNTIDDTLKSVASQTYRDIEHIIVDGSSTDNTLEIAKAYPHVCKIISEKDKGIYDAMNKGIGYATGDIVGILNSDDLYHSPGVLEKVVRAFQDPSVEAVYGNLQYVKPDDITRVTRNWVSGKFSPRKFYFGWMPPHPSFFVRRSVYERYGKFNEHLRTSADYEFMLRVLVKHHCRAVYLPELIVRMRTGGMSNATWKHRLKANREDREAWKINGLTPYFFTIPLKPTRKIFQYIFK